MASITKQTELPRYITKDGSTICELMYPAQHSNANQSLAQALIPPGCETQLHYHAITEELYHIQQGQGLMTLGEKQFSVEKGDTICIPPTHYHKLKNTGSSDLVLLCCCSPAYSHDDTFLMTDQ